MAAVLILSICPACLLIKKANFHAIIVNPQVTFCAGHAAHGGPCQRHLASQSPLVHASHRQWHWVSLSTTVCQGVCSCKILSNIIYFNSLQIGMGTAKTLPPNTSLILQAMANSLQT